MQKWGDKGASGISQLFRGGGGKISVRPGAVNPCYAADVKAKSVCVWGGGKMCVPRPAVEPPPV